MIQNTKSHRPQLLTQPESTSGINQKQKSLCWLEIIGNYIYVRTKRHILCGQMQGVGHVNNLRTDIFYQNRFEPPVDELFCVVCTYLGFSLCKLFTFPIFFDRFWVVRTTEYASQDHHDVMSVQKK